MKKLDYYEICKQKLKYLNYSDRTIKSYLFYINQRVADLAAKMADKLIKKLCENDKF